MFDTCIWEEIYFPRDLRKNFILHFTSLLLRCVFYIRNFTSLCFSERPENMSTTFFKPSHFENFFTKRLGGKFHRRTKITERIWNFEINLPVDRRSSWTNLKIMWFWPTNFWFGANQSRTSVLLPIITQFCQNQNLRVTKLTQWDTCILRIMGKWEKYCRNERFGDIIGQNKKFKWMFLVVWAEISWQTACVRATNNQDYECCKFQRFSSVHKFTTNLIKKSKIFAINKSFWKCEVRSKFPCGITFLRVF